MTVESRKKESSEIYVRAVGDAVTGLVVLCAEPRELTIVNIVGKIDLDELSELGGNLGVPKIDLEKPKPAPKKDDD